MFRVVENGLAGTGFDNFPLIHHQDAIAEQPHDVQIVRNKQITHTEALPQAGQEMQDHRLHRHIEGRRGFVQNEQCRVQGNGARNPDAGFLAARELMWKALKEIDWEPYQLGQFLYPVVDLGRLRTLPRRRSGSATVAKAVKRGFRLSVGS